MGMVYGVYYKLKFKKEVVDKCIEDLKKFELLSSYKGEYNIKDITSYVLCIDREDNSIIEKRGEFDFYENFFNAVYGYESLLNDYFKILTPYLEDKSVFYLECDCGSYKYTIKNGVAEFKNIN